MFKPRLYTVRFTGEVLVYAKDPTDAVHHAKHAIDQVGAAAAGLYADQPLELDSIFEVDVSWRDCIPFGSEALGDMTPTEYFVKYGDDDGE